MTPPPSLRGVRTTAAPHHRQIEQQPHGERSRQVPRQADMSMSMPIDRVNSAFLLQSVAEPLVTERDDHLPEKISWQKSEFNGQKPVELNHFNHGEMYYPVNLPSAKTRLVHKDFHFQLGVRGNGQVSVVEQPQHDQKSLEKDFSTVTRHTAESRRPHRKKKNPRGLQKTNPPGGEQTPQGTIITSFQAPSLLGRVLMVFAWNWAAKLIKTDFFVPCRGHRLSQTSNFP
jgi:hypothetical protein